MYDAVWMVARALNKSIGVLAGRNLTLADFTYENDEIRQVFIEQLSRLEFRGVSVSICHWYILTCALLGNSCY